MLEAHAYYLLGGTTLTGRWIDSRGVMLSIKAEIIDSTLVAHWSGEENGRTEYHVIDEITVEVTDYVQANGEYYPFARARSTSPSRINMVSGLLRLVISSPRFGREKRMCCLRGRGSYILAAAPSGATVGS